MNPHCFSLGRVAAKGLLNAKQSLSSDAGFSGYTHALSGVAVASLFFAFAPGFVDIGMLGLTSIAIIVAFIWATVGATLVPDLDNTSSTSRNSLGFAGVLLCNVFRYSSLAIQTVIRTPKDDATPDPHRGFWHTGISAFILGGGVYLLSLMSKEIDVPLLGTYTVGALACFLVFFAMVHLTLSALAKKGMNKIRKGSFAGELIALLVSFVISGFLFYFVPRDDYLWLAVAMAGGCLIHILGDSFTKKGTPFWSPFTVFFKGRFWYNTRIMRLESGGDTEQKIVTKVLWAFIIIGIIKLVIDLFAPQGI